MLATPVRKTIRGEHQYQLYLLSIAKYHFDEDDSFPYCMWSEESSLLLPSFDFNPSNTPPRAPTSQKPILFAHHGRHHKRRPASQARRLLWRVLLPT